MRIGLLAASMTLPLIGCSAGRELPPSPQTNAYQVLAGQVGGGRPPDGNVPSRLALRFKSDSGRTVETVARDGWYEVRLTPGFWNVRSDDGGVCVRGIQVLGGGSRRWDLIWPVAECYDVLLPPAPTEAPTPTGF